jgi:hypothetical protein
MTDPLRSSLITLLFMLLREFPLDDTEQDTIIKTLLDVNFGVIDAEKPESAVHVFTLLLVMEAVCTVLTTCPIFDGYACVVESLNVIAVPLTVIDITPPPRL